VGVNFTRTGDFSMTNISVVITPPFRSNPHIVATASVSITTEGGTLTINDGRVLLNRNGVLWFSLPTYSIPNGRNYQYKSTVELSPALALQVSSAVLQAYEQWQAERGVEAVGR
jgi:hypothetical protein